MVCERCISIVQKELNQLNIPFKSVRLGEVTVEYLLVNDRMSSLRQALAKYGFEVMDDKQSGLVKNIKAIVEELFSDDSEPISVKFSTYISGKLYKDYDVVSSSFSACEGITLEKYILGKRIEKVKELLIYSRQSISDIAFNLNYSSVAHLSKQFKAITGLNLSHFRQINAEKQAAPVL